MRLITIKAYILSYIINVIENTVRKLLDCGKVEMRENFYLLQIVIVLKYFNKNNK